MKYATLIAGAIIFAQVSSAQTTAAQQWKTSQLTMFDLVGKGYRVVGYQDNTTPASGYNTTTYLLQKDASLFRCDERLMSYDSKTNKSKSFFICWELVKPFD